MDIQKSLYLKYRPSQLSEIVGQKPIVATLKQASTDHKFVHSYLFSGNHGSGKTTSARILATLMTCEDVKDGETCGKCRACKTIKRGSSADVRELDGASNNKVEEARKIIDAAFYAPHELKKKVYIIDECHMLTTSANNALLKIVEEPPSYLAFIFCTTEPKKMLSTIISRCQRFNFTRIITKDIVNRLKFIAKEEKININEKALVIISKIARGSMRDAIGCLEQIGTLASNKNLEITEEHIQKYFGVTDRLGILKMVKAMISGNVPLILDQVNDMVMASADTKSILLEVSEIFRNIMVLKIQNNTKLVDLPDNEIKELKDIGKSLDANKLVKLSHLFANIDKKLNFNINERWIMEATLIECMALLRK